MDWGMVEAIGTWFGAISAVIAVILVAKMPFIQRVKVSVSLFPHELNPKNPSPGAEPFFCFNIKNVGYQKVFLRGFGFRLKGKIVYCQVQDYYDGASEEALSRAKDNLPIKRNVFPIKLERGQSALLAERQDKIYSQLLTNDVRSSDIKKLIPDCWTQDDRVFPSKMYLSLLHPKCFHKAYRKKVADELRLRQQNRGTNL